MTFDEWYDDPATQDALPVKARDVTRAAYEAGARSRALRSELAEAKAELEQAREENVVLAEMVWDAAEFWWERARQFSHEMDTVSELEAMRIHAILSKLYERGYAASRASVARAALVNRPEELP